MGSARHYAAKPRRIVTWTEETPLAGPIVIEVLSQLGETGALFFRVTFLKGIQQRFPGDLVNLQRFGDGKPLLQNTPCYCTRFFPLLNSCLLKLTS